jgi:predicted dehydrogenase
LPQTANLCGVDGIAPPWRGDQRANVTGEVGILVGSRHLPLGVGVIGLGRLWETRHKPSLMRLQDRFRVTAVYDQVARRAALEADALGCAACTGLTALLDRPDVDVVYLLSPQWFGLHPAYLACDRRKPIYCALPLAGELDELQRLASRLEETATPFMPEFARRFYPATLRLKELLATSLGPPRLILGHTRLFGYDRYAQPGPATQIAPAPLLVDPGSYLLDWSCDLLQSLPEAISGSSHHLFPEESGENRGPDYESFVATFAGGASVLISYGRYHRARWGEASRFLPAAGFQVFAERGAAWVEMPDRIQWADARGAQEEQLPLEPTVGDVLNDQFYRLICGSQSLAPSIHDALKVARLVRDLRRSREHGVVVRRTEDRS